MAPPLTVPVLVVDDNAAKRVALRAVLTPLGHSIVEAASGEAALRCLVEQNFAVILLDVRMPLMDGFETAKLIRQSHGSETTPIIFITAYGRDEILDIERYAEGAVDFIFAPVPAEELRAKVTAFANMFLQSTSLAASALAAQTAADELKAVNDRLAIIVRQDPLTGLGNRRAIEEDLELLEARVRRYGHSYCLALFDVDKFKSYNDANGHVGGDEALRAVAGQLQRHARRGDSIYRYGGDEFLCIFPEQSLENGGAAARRMQLGLEAVGMPHTDNPAGVLTVSAGLAILDPKFPRLATEVLREADRALYRSKGLGGNRVESLHGADHADHADNGFIDLAAVPPT